MEPYMEIFLDFTKKTTILFSPDLHQRLARLAAQRGVSIGHLVREACVRQYGLVASEDRVDAVRALAGLALPVGSPAKLKRESVPGPDDLLP
jgi:predicted DNA-binding protein